MAASNYGVVSVVQPPLLKTVDQPSLIKFETAFAAYRQKVADVNKDRDDNSKLSPASVKDCMDSATLHALCLMGEIGSASTVEEATAEMVQTWFERASLSTPKDLSERIDSTLRSVTYKPNKDDLAGGVSNFIIDVITALDQNNASEVLKESDMAKKFLDRLVHKFQQDILQERIKMLRCDWKKYQLADIKRFKDEVANVALDVSLTETAMARVKPRSRPTRERLRKQEESPKPDKAGNSAGRSQANGNQRSSKRKQEECTDPCLNPDFTRVYRLKDCPISSAERKKELFEKHYSLRDTKRAKAVKITEEDTETGNVSDTARFRIALEDILFGTVLGDSGADFSAIYSNMFTKVTTAVPGVSTKVLEKPISLVGAFKTTEGTQASASRSVVLSITVYLPLSNLPGRVRGVEFFVVDQVLDEVLLGRPFLNSIGFNLESHLAQVRDDIHDKHIDDLNPAHFKLAAAKYDGLSYTNADDDPIALPECLAAGVGEDSEESIDQALSNILTEAKSNGMSSAGLARTERMLNEYRDVFPINLGPDPPADVPPLVITPQENAKPYRLRQQRYAPRQRDFIIETVRELEAVGAIYKNSAARWASPALAVPKPQVKHAKQYISK